MQLQLPKIENLTSETGLHTGLGISEERLDQIFQCCQKEVIKAFEARGGNTDDIEKGNILSIFSNIGAELDPTVEEWIQISIGTMKIIEHFNSAKRRTVTEVIGDVIKRYTN